MRRMVLGLAIGLLVVGCDRREGAGGPAGGRDTAAAPSVAQDTATAEAIDSTALQACRDAKPVGAPKEIDVGDYNLQLTAVEGSIAPWEEGVDRVIGILGTTGQVEVREYNLRPGERTCWWAQASNSGDYIGYYVRLTGTGMEASPQHKLVFEQHPEQQAPHASPEARWNIVKRRPPKPGETQMLQVTVAQTEVWAACASNACCRPRS